MKIPFLPSRSPGRPERTGRMIHSGRSGFLGIDCLALPENFSGAAYYICHLTNHLLNMPRSFPVAVFCKPRHRELFGPQLRGGDKIVTVDLPNRLAQLYYYEFRLQRRLLAEEVGTLYATHYLCPPASDRYRLINTFHDLGFLLHPHYYSIVKRLYFGLRMRTFLERTDQIIAVSQATARAIARRFPEHAAKVAVVYSGADHLLSGKSLPLRAAQSPSPFILAVNTFEIRKNIPFIIRVFERLKRDAQIPHALVLVGLPANDSGAISAQIRRSPYRRDITVAPAVTTAKLIQYYRQCDFFLNGSEYEGFGFTPFEAINFERPVFLYQNNAVKELLGDHPYIFTHRNVRRWAAVIRAAMEDGFSRKITPEAIRHLTWANTTRGVLKILHENLPFEETSVAS